MRAIIAIALLTVSLFISGCATTAKYEAVLNSWLNADINSLTDSLSPTMLYVLKTGK